MVPHYAETLVPQTADVIFCILGISYERIEARFLINILLINYINLPHMK